MPASTDATKILRRVRANCRPVLTRFKCINDDDKGYTYFADFVRGHGWVIVEMGWGENFEEHADGKIGHLHYSVTIRDYTCPKGAYNYGEKYTEAGQATG